MNINFNNLKFDIQSLTNKLYAQYEHANESDIPDDIGAYSFCAYKVCNEMYIKHVTFLDALNKWYIDNNKKNIPIVKNLNKVIDNNHIKKNTKPKEFPELHTFVGITHHDINTLYDQEFIPPEDYILNFFNIINDNVDKFIHHINEIANADIDTMEEFSYDQIFSDIVPSSNISVYSIESFQKLLYDTGIGETLTHVILDKSQIHKLREIFNEYIEKNIFDDIIIKHQSTSPKIQRIFSILKDNPNKCEGVKNTILNLEKVFIIKSALYQTWASLTLMMTKELIETVKVWYTDTKE